MKKIIAFWRYLFPTITISRDEFFEFIKKPADSKEYLSKPTLYYMNFYDKHIHEKKFISWNWASLTGVWFFYRKMYVIFAIITFEDLFFIAYKYHTNSTFLHTFTEHSIHFLIYFFLTAFSNYLYLLQAQRNYTKNVNKKNTSTSSKKSTFAMFIIYIMISVTSYYNDEKSTTELSQTNNEEQEEITSAPLNRTYAEWFLGEKNRISEVDTLIIINHETGSETIFIDWSIAQDICRHHFDLEENSFDNGRPIWKVEGMPDPSKIEAMREIQRIRNEERRKSRTYSPEEIEGTT